MSPGGRRATRVAAAGVLTIAVIVLAIKYVVLPSKPADANSTNQSTASPAPSASGAPTLSVSPGAAPPVSPSPAATASPSASPAPTIMPPASMPATASTQIASAPEAKAAFESGLKLLADGKSMPARAALTEAVLSQKLSAQDEARAVKELTTLANKTFFSRELVEGDPYVTFYVVKPKDTLEGANGIEMTQKLHVPARLLLKINGLSRGADMRPGQMLKLIKGPFHAIVYKGRFLMDLYVQRDNEDRVFVRRVPVGLGANGTTQVGAWRVQQGQKMERPPYNATPLSGLPVGAKILADDPAYPFGKKALWIGLEGVDAKTAGITDFGIHSTNDPNSIGKASSLGCVRMSDADIDLVFSLLYDVHSGVDVVP